MNTTTIQNQQADLTLGAKVLKGLRWELIGQLAMQFLRFGSNLILTRLLASQAFGVMGLAQVFVMFLTLFSDVGLRGSVIHHERGDEDEFLDTVWTVGVIRGFILWFVTCLGAAPFARFYEMPELTWVLPLIGFTSVIRGFASTSVMTAGRHLDNQWFVKVQCGSTMIGTIGTVLFAFLVPNVLALALGWVVAAVAYVVISYLKPGQRFNRFCWDRDAARSLAGFGRWAMASSGLTIFQQQGDRLLLGKVTSASQLGYYVVGANLASLPLQTFTRINAGVLQPMYSRLRSDDPQRIRKKIKKVRWGVICTFVPAMSLLTLISQPLIDLLYEADYAKAGWYCGMACIAVLARIATDMGPIFPAHGDSKTHFHIMTVRSVVLALAMFVGYQLGDRHGHAVDGVLFGLILAPIISYPYQARLYRKLNAWFPEVDIVGIVASIALTAWMLTRL